MLTASIQDYDKWTLKIPRGFLALCSEASNFIRFIFDIEI